MQPDLMISDAALDEAYLNGGRVGYAEASSVWHEMMRSELIGLLQLGVETVSYAQAVRWVDDRMAELRVIYPERF